VFSSHGEVCAHTKFHTGLSERSIVWEWKENEVIIGEWVCIWCEGYRCLNLLSWWCGEGPECSSAPVVVVVASGNVSCQEVVVIGE